MMTLDDVIEAMERCSIPHYFDCKGCPYEDDDAEVGCRSDDRDADALHYLREYISNQDTITEQLEELERQKDKVCDLAKTVTEAYDRLTQRLAEENRNNPLTWDELRTMEGKPVWIEAESLSVGVSPYWKDWYIIKSFSNDEFMYCNDGFEWAKEMQGRLWQAYRKERE